MTAPVPCYRLRALMCFASGGEFGTFNTDGTDGSDGECGNTFGGESGSSVNSGDRGTFIRNVDAECSDGAKCVQLVTATTLSAVKLPRMAMTVTYALSTKIRIQMVRWELQ